MRVRIPKELGAVAKFVFGDPTRYALTGVNVSVDAKGVRLSASDGICLVDIRLGDKDDRVDRNELGKESVIVPAREFAQAARSCGRHEVGNVGFWVGTRPDERLSKPRVQLESDDLETTHKIDAPAIDGTFPDVDAVGPEGKPDAEITVNPRRLGEALLALAAMKTAKTPSVKLQVHSSGEKHQIVMTMKTDVAEIRSVLMGMSR